MKKKNLKIGIIGLGRILPKHLEDSIKQINQFKLVALCDIDENIGKAIAKKEKVKYYKNYQDLIKDKSIDIVSILTPNYLHYEMGIFTAKMKKHAIVEKPISLNYEQAQDLIKAFEKSNKQLFPVLQVRFNSPIRIAKKYVQEGALGKILTARLSVHWTRPQEYYDESPWKGKKDLDGGSLLSQAIHYLDSLCWILGKPKSLIAKTATAGHKIEVEDIANAIIDFESGSRVSFDFTVCTYPHNQEASLTLLGETGTIKIGGVAMNKIETWEVKNIPLPDIPETPGPNVYAGGMYVGSVPNHRFVYEDVVNTLLFKKKSFIKAEDALMSLKIIDAIHKSDNKKKEVSL